MSIPDREFRAERTTYCIPATAREQTGALTRRKELFNGEYRNTAKGMQHHQVVIGSHDASRVSADGEFKKLVIAGIAASDDLLSNIDEFCRLNKRVQESLSILTSDIAVELFSTQHIVQFFRNRQ